MVSGTLPNLEVFCRTYETNSLTKAARVLNVTPQATSRSIARLERALGVTLFRRTTRRLAPTDAAHRYYEICSRALSLLVAGENELLAGRTTPEGQVRVSAPTTYGHHRLIPALAAFRERYPRIQVEVNVDNRNIDFATSGFDLAIRMGPITHKTVIARRLDEFALGVYAAPSYIARFGEPKTPDDLARHTCIGFLMPSSGRILPWTFTPGPKNFVPDAAYRCSDDVLGTIGLARAGVGLVQIYDFLVEQDLTLGSLVEVLKPFRGQSRPFSLLYPKAARPTRAVRAMIDFILDSARMNAKQRTR
jgi:DNA-binding transcriptional LysR family regulator